MLCKEGLLQDAIHIAEAMQHNPNLISRNNAYHLLRACEKLEDPECARKLFCLMIQSGLDSTAVLGDHLIRIFSCHRSLVEANQVFNKISKPSAYTWNAIIMGTAKYGGGHLAMDLYVTMQQLGLRGDRYIYVAVLKACAVTNAAFEGRLLSDQMMESGFEVNVVIGNTLVDMYIKCGIMEDAYKVFEHLSVRDVVSWTAIIAGYAQHGRGYLSLKYFYKMQNEEVMPNQITFLSVLKACVDIMEIERARSIHEQIISLSFQSDIIIGGTLVDTYAKCGHLDEAESVLNHMPFRNLVSWNAMIAGYAQHGEYLGALECIELMQEEGNRPDEASWNAIITGYAQNGEGLLALECFVEMQRNGIRPNQVTYLSLFKACSIIGVIEHGRLIHEHFMENGLDLNALTGSSLVDMYSKCSGLNEANKCFRELLVTNIVLWSAMIAAYVQHGEDFLALDCFEKMKQESLRPNEVTFSAALRACGNMGAIEQGRLIHEQIIKDGLEANYIVGNTLVDLYAKCGALGEACHVFDGLKFQNVVSWNALLTAYAQHGEGLLAIKTFESMQEGGIIPNEISFASILIACSRAGLVDVGRWYFQSMRELHGLTPTTSHCTCMVDILGRAGYLSEAEDLLRDNLPTNVVGWTSLLTACQMHGNIEIGKHCFSQIALNLLYTPVSDIKDTDALKM